MLPHRMRQMVGPWIFFDHAPSAELPIGEAVNVRPHPHINLATTTYLFEGEIFHRDSLGNEVSIHPRDLNIMVAGKGIVHSERERPECTQKERRLNLLQLWFALPESVEEIDPAFFHYNQSQIPEVTEEKAVIRVLIGSAYGVSSPAIQYSPTLYCTIKLAAGATIAIPDTVTERAVYVVSGSIQHLGKTITEHTMLIFNSSSQEITACEDSILALIGGEPLGKRYIWWNFVSSSRERIEQAKQDWKTKKFPIIPSDNEEFIPLPR